ncbi:ABC transporter permease subunit [Nesterenkonia sandarakina]|uniref:Maltose/maltodextrin transport system permease protein n=1 Tax=Nesterenkonia sandarakina TaxID=272918 RepID=A0A7Z0EA16_9MICC|nr:ABC transporter permease subunit [Nesterenkonia sandarakina]NYJ17713.1 arabinogalactan oligomer/maltooligosaccharide transport system permease protein [Nesterenkonia sandarakina]
MSAPTTTRPDERTVHGRRARRTAESASIGWKLLLLKITVLGLLNAVSVYAAMVLFFNERWIIGTLVVVSGAILTWIYLQRGALPAKYLAPGVVFLLIFQVFVILYSGYVAFTNYGTGHNSTKDHAIHAIMLQTQDRVPDSPTYPLTVVESSDELGFAVTTEDGEILIGSADAPLEAVEGAVVEDGRVVQVPDHQVLSFADLVERQQELTTLAVPLSDDPNAGALRTQDGQRAYVYTSRFVYDESSDTMTNTQTGQTYTDGGEGAFVTEAGEELMPGWRVNVGLENFVRAITEESIRGPLLYVTTWTFAFAFLSVASTFILGLFLAIVFNDPRMKSRKYYRLVMILPYAFPGFLSALVWAGMMNQEFGFINNVLFGGAAIPWLSDPWLAKLSILIVNLWLGFPYMFLVCTGALQSIPEELTEAAQMDGARPFQAFRQIKFPLLLVSIAPLLISSFAFNFNNFNLVYMLTGGGPRDIEAGINVGSTDILISMVYKVAFVGSQSDYGLASAFSILIFFIVGTISVIAFRRTRALEELN